MGWERAAGASRFEGPRLILSTCQVIVRLTRVFTASVGLTCYASLRRCED